MLMTALLDNRTGIIIPTLQMRKVGLEELSLKLQLVSGRVISDSSKADHFTHTFCHLNLGPEPRGRT